MVRIFETIGGTELGSGLGEDVEIIASEIADGCDFDLRVSPCAEG
jgi:hypothetical protein